MLSTLTLVFEIWYLFVMMLKWDKVFNSGPSKICGRQPLKNLNQSLYQSIFYQSLTTIAAEIKEKLSKSRTNPSWMN